MVSSPGKVVHHFSPLHERSYAPDGSIVNIKRKIQRIVQVRKCRYAWQDGQDRRCQSLDHKVGKRGDVDLILASRGREPPRPTRFTARSSARAWCSSSLARCDALPRRREALLRERERVALLRERVSAWLSFASARARGSPSRARERVALLRERDSAALDARDLDVLVPVRVVALVVDAVALVAEHRDDHRRVDGALPVDPHAIA